jgi:hypothetical protein
LQLKNVPLAFRVALTQGPHVRGGQLRHEFFDLVGAQLLGQQGGAFALALQIEPVNADGRNEQKTDEFHKFKKAFDQIGLNAKCSEWMNPHRQRPCVSDGSGLAPGFFRLGALSRPI